VPPSQQRQSTEGIQSPEGILRTLMWPIVTDQVEWSVGLSVTVVSPAKTAGPIEMPFGMLSWVNPGIHVLDGSADAPMGRGTFK